MTDIITQDSDYYPARYLVIKHGHPTEYFYWYHNAVQRAIHLSCDHSAVGFDETTTKIWNVNLFTLAVYEEGKRIYHIY